MKRKTTKMIINFFLNIQLIPPDQSNNINDTQYKKNNYFKNKKSSIKQTEKPICII